MEVEIPPDVSIEQLDSDRLPGWDREESPAARALGDRWARRRTLILVVPSVATSGISRNLIINQDHPEFARLTATGPQPVHWDARLFSALMDAIGHRSRVHLALEKDTPEPRPIQPPESGRRIVAIPVLGGLHHRYERRAA